eukprot:2842976-Rhodomonas_salina.1
MQQRDPEQDSLELHTYRLAELIAPPPVSSTVFMISVQVLANVNSMTTFEQMLLHKLTKRGGGVNSAGRLSTRSMNSIIVLVSPWYHATPFCQLGETQPKMRVHPTSSGLASPFSSSLRAIFPVFAPSMLLNTCARVPSAHTHTPRDHASNTTFWTVDPASEGTAKPNTDACFEMCWIRDARRRIGRRP